jgi:hypothetical protein
VRIASKGDVDFGTVMASRIVSRSDVNSQAADTSSAATSNGRVIQPVIRRRRAAP